MTPACFNCKKSVEKANTLIVKFESIGDGVRIYLCDDCYNKLNELMEKEYGYLSPGSPIPLHVMGKLRSKSASTKE